MSNQFQLILGKPIEKPFQKFLIKDLIYFGIFAVFLAIVYVLWGVQIPKDRLTKLENKLQTVNSRIEQTIQTTIKKNAKYRENIKNNLVFYNKISHEIDNKINRVKKYLVYSGDSERGQKYIDLTNTLINDFNSVHIIKPFIKRAFSIDTVLNLKHVISLDHEDKLIISRQTSIIDFEKLNIKTGEDITANNAEFTNNKKTAQKSLKTSLIKDSAIWLKQQKQSMPFSGPPVQLSPEEKQIIQLKSIIGHNPNVFKEYESAITAANKTLFTARKGDLELRHYNGQMKIVKNKTEAIHSEYMKRLNQVYPELAMKIELPKKPFKLLLDESTREFVRLRNISKKQLLKLENLLAKDIEQIKTLKDIPKRTKQQKNLLKQTKSKAREYAKQIKELKSDIGEYNSLIKNTSEWVE